MRKYKDRKNGQWVNMGMGRWRMEKWGEWGDGRRRTGGWENRRTGEQENRRTGDRKAENRTETRENFLGRARVNSKTQTVRLKFTWDTGLHPVASYLGQQDASQCPR
ncbi:uncharacterized protein EDB91DRAFT_1079161 [Suillus paluster]|uniref:uncharacterized protein n=1 Tax=Suillus paluster TaxID=48578 RepID=UPI001B876A5A|nr:uncharacterized protein EDB91DRAFT_1079161 [Suillus paluster]KAG1749070.1 hypothetical protein EDB91DRAFT_1079161 [Suillus paluster]